MAKPTTLFIHGAWHNPNHFKPVVRLFESAGYPAICPCLPTFGASPPNMKMYEDAKCIRDELEKLVKQEGKEVVVVMHSYGGLVGTEAVHESLGKRVREADGLAGGVIGMVYMCAFLLPEGHSLWSTFGGTAPPIVTVHVSTIWTRTPFQPKFPFLNTELCAETYPPSA
jgi:pimeloyl-ACP methyl ester carboxylesterase